MKKQLYRILSPDNIDISHEKQLYTRKEITPALKQFSNNYTTQGHYSQICYNGYRREIPVNQIADYCEIITI